jgi:hypothetical protein
MLEPGGEPEPERSADVLRRVMPERALLWALSDFDGSRLRWHS